MCDVWVEDVVLYRVEGGCGLVESGGRKEKEDEL
jgi:hypothetical protein